MSAHQEFLLPDVGEGLTEADILRWAVRPGDTVEVNQVLVEVETAKAAVELPSPYAGTVTALHAEEGETVEVGKPLITIGTGEPEDDDTGKVLVGYGPAKKPRAQQRKSVVEPSRPPAPDHGRPAAKPPVRKLAKDLGVDLTTVTPTGPNGTISREDIRRAVETPAPAPAGRETRVPIRGVRKHTAAAMVASAFTAPHVTEFLTVDLTATMRLRETVLARREFRDVKLSPLAFVARAFLLAMRTTPEANSSWDEQAQEIVVKHYVNLGIAAATGRGLVVPNIKDADAMSLRELAEAITKLAETARAGRTTPEDMSGGTVTITNVGVFGVDGGTPILNPGETAILAVGAVRRAPWVVTGETGEERIEPRWVTQLSLSFDHRIVDGQQGSQLLADTAAILHDPGLALL